jgi:hypothetical protein
LLTETMGTGMDPPFDALLHSLGKIAQKSPKPVIDSIYRWRKSQESEPLSTDLVRLHTAQSPMLTRGGGGGTNATSTPARVRVDVSAVLHERREMASVFIMTQALIAVMQAVFGSKEGKGAAAHLDENTAVTLAQSTFDVYVNADLRLLANSTNLRQNEEVYARLLGEVAKARFMTVTDLFLSELAPVTAGQITKDADLRYENIVRGLKYVQIKVKWQACYLRGMDLNLLPHLGISARSLRRRSRVHGNLLQIVRECPRLASKDCIC